jgi:hypothetical protein
MTVSIKSGSVPPCRTDHQLNANIFGGRTNWDSTGKWSRLVQGSRISLNGIRQAGQSYPETGNQSVSYLTTGLERAGWPARLPHFSPHRAAKVMGSYPTKFLRQPGSLSASAVNTPMRRMLSCPRAATGHAAAAPPSSDMNSRRFIRSPRRRGRATSAGFLDRRLSQSRG